MKKSKAYSTARRIRGGYGVPAPRKRVSPFFNPLVSEEVINKKLKRGPLPPLDKPVTLPERVKSALNTEINGRLMQLRRNANLSRLRKLSLNQVRGLETLARMKQEKTQRNMLKKNNPRTKVETLPLSDVENGSLVTTKGKSRFDKVTTTTSVKLDLAGPVKQRSFYTKVSFGKPSSKALLQAKKLNGSKTIQLWNSLTDSNFKDPTKEYKEYNEIVAGFNIKTLYTSQYLVPSFKSVISDIYKVTLDSTTDGSAPNPDAAPTDNNLAVYGCALNMNSKYTFRNNMNATSVVMKIHFIALKDRNATSATYSAPLDNLASSGQMNGLDRHRLLRSAHVYPRPYYRSSGTYNATSNPIQYAEDTTNSHAYAASVVPSVDMRESERFNEKFTIVKTLERTLDVGDDWTVDVLRTLGSGIRLDEALRIGQSFGHNSVNQALVPLGLRMVIEIYGKKIVAEAVKKDTYSGSTGQIAAQDTIVGEDKFIGSAPCSVSWEAQHYITYVLQSYSGVPSSLNESTFESRVGGPLIRTYYKDTVIPQIPYCVDYWKIHGNTTYLSPVRIQSAMNATVQTVTTTT